MSKRSRGEKGEKAVISFLSDLPDYHHVLNDVTLVNASSGMSHQIDHVLLHPHGVFVIETKNYAGTINVNECSGEWWSKIRGKSHRIGNPLRQNKSHAIALRKALKGEVHPVPVVVFVQNNAPYLGDENVINLKDLALFIDSYPYEKTLTPKTLDSLKKKIEEAAVPLSREEHVENIAILKQVRKEQQAEMTYAIEQRKCPRCEGEILTDGETFVCVNCGYHFSL